MRRSSFAKPILFFVWVPIMAILLFGLVVMFLWNNVLAVVLHISIINYAQALGILLLSKILFGFRMGGWRGRRDYFRGGMTQEWNNMTPEQRDKFKQEWQRRCGRWGYKPWADSPGNTATAEKGPEQS
jgi:hypothetical protein